MELLITILVILILFGCIGGGGYRYAGWRGPYYGGGLGLIVIVLIVLLLLGII